MMVRRILLGALALVALVAAPAVAQYVPLVITPRNVVPGGEVTISGQGCRPGAPVTVYLMRGNLVVGGSVNRPPSTVTPVGTTVSDDSGNFTLTFTIPLSTKPGIYTVVAVCDRPVAAATRGAGTRAEPALVLGQTITVLSPTVAPTTPGTTPDPSNPGTGSGSASGSGSGSLPRTGSDLDGLGLAGVALLVVGDLVLLATRRRSAGASASA